MENPLSSQPSDLLASLAALPPDQLGAVAVMIEKLRRGEHAVRPAQSPGFNLTITLCQFFETWGEPIYLRQRRKVDEKTIVTYRDAFKHWRTLMGDPPIAVITEETLEEFVKQMEQLPGRKGATMSGWTIAKHARCITAILNRAGPPRSGTKYCQSIVESVPCFGTIKKPRAECSGAFTLDELAAMWQAAGKMKAPRLASGTAAQWWRGLLAVGYVGMVRINSLLHLEFADVDRDGWVQVKDEHAKSHRGYSLYLPRHVLRALAFGDPRRSKVFPCVGLDGYAIGNLRARFKRLQRMAGIPKHLTRGFHGLRKLGATELAKIDPLAAQMQLGHAGATVLQSHYLNRKGGLLSEAVEKMPWPIAGKVTVKV